MLKITDTNYDYYKRVFEIIFVFIWRDNMQFIRSDVSPIHVLNELETRSKTKAKAGLRISLLDLLSMVKHDLAQDERNGLHQKLLEEGFSGLWKLISLIDNTAIKVLKRGKIRSIEEWYVIKEILDATDSNMSQGDRKRLGELLVDFEQLKKKSDR